MTSQHNPRDPHLVDQMVHEVKSQGVFDEFRKSSIADVDTKPAYQNLRQRVENSVKKFLSEQEWSPEMNKLQLREKLRKHIQDAGFLDVGVERIVDQVVNPKIATIFRPRIEEIAYKFLGLPPPEKPDNFQPILNPLSGLPINGVGLHIDTENLLPTDLEQVSPESDLKDEPMDLENSDEESPPFEPLEEKPPTYKEDKNLNDDLPESEKTPIYHEDSINNSETIILKKEETLNAFSVEAFKDAHSPFEKMETSPDITDSKLLSGQHASINTSEETQISQLNNNQNQSENLQSRIDSHCGVKKDEIKFEVIQKDEEDCQSYCGAEGEKTLEVIANNDGNENRSNGEFQEKNDQATESVSCIPIINDLKPGKGEINDKANEATLREQVADKNTIYPDTSLNISSHSQEESYEKKTSSVRYKNSQEKYQSTDNVSKKDKNRSAGKNREHHRDKYRERSKHRERERIRDKDKERDKHKRHSRSGDREKERSHNRSRERDRVKDNAMDRNKAVEKTYDKSSNISSNSHKKYSSSDSHRSMKSSSSSKKSKTEREKECGSSVSQSKNTTPISSLCSNRMDGNKQNIGNQDLEKEDSQESIRDRDRESGRKYNCKKGYKKSSSNKSDSNQKSKNADDHYEKKTKIQHRNSNDSNDDDKINEKKADIFKDSTDCSKGNNSENLSFKSNDIPDSEKSYENVQTENELQHIEDVSEKDDTKNKSEFVGIRGGTSNVALNDNFCQKSSKYSERPRLDKLLSEEEIIQSAATINELKNDLFPKETFNCETTENLTKHVENARSSISLKNEKSIIETKILQSFRNKDYILYSNEITKDSLVNKDFIERLLLENDAEFENYSRYEDFLGFESDSEQRTISTMLPKLDQIRLILLNDFLCQEAQNLSLSYHEKKYGKNLSKSIDDSKCNSSRPTNTSKDDFAVKHNSDTSHVDKGSFKCQTNSHKIKRFLNIDADYDDNKHQSETTPRKQSKVDTECSVKKLSPVPSDSSFNSKENDRCCKNTSQTHELLKRSTRKIKKSHKQQRYNSDDLYKPRPVLSQRTRRRDLLE